MLAVLVNSNTLFILIGKEDVNTVISPPLMLNVTNPSKITLLDKYYDFSIQSLPNDPKVRYIYSLPKEAIIGLIVGCVVFVRKFQ